MGIISQNQLMFRWRLHENTFLKKFVNAMKLEPQEKSSSSQPDL